MNSVFLQRLAARLTAVLVLLAVAVCPALPVLADAGDYDEITNYVVTVDPRRDGSADIPYPIDWQVIGGGSEDYLSWVNIGLANEYADEFENLTPDTVADVSLNTDSGSYARVTFHDRYYAPDVAAENGGESAVHFSFRVHQSHLFTENDDRTASFSFTPGWFDEICVDSLTVRWRNYDGFEADNQTVEGDYLVWQFGPLGHGEKATVNVKVPVTTSQVFDPDAARTGEEMTPVGYETSNSGAEDAVAILLVFVVLFALAFVFASRPARWRGGFGAPAYDPLAWAWFYNGTHYIRMPRGRQPPAGYHASTPPPGFQSGGGETRGGGAGRDTSHHGSCVCACACVSCACACACAGGGRAGCSVKNFYRVALPLQDRPEEEASHES